MYKCGIDIGGTNIKFGIFNESDELVESFSIKTSKVKEEIVNDIINTVKSKYDIKDILGYTIAIPGVVRHSRVIYAPNTNIVGLNFTELLSNAFDNDVIIIENDANLAALAESRISKIDNLVLITLGTGVGGGIILDGNLFNYNGFAGEIGHIKVDITKNARKCGCGKYGCVEAYASAIGIVKDYNQLKGTNITSKELFEYAEAGDKDAIDSIDDALRKLAATIADITAILSIKDIRLSGGMSKAGNYLLDRIRKFYKEYSLENNEDVKIEFAQLGSEAGIYAAKYLIK